jgi:DHA2 family multidrug resistance protein
MATAASAPASPLASRITAFERRMIMFGTMLSVFMQVLDTTIANVALPHMQTSLNATPETVTWVLTSYIVASAVAMPITGWLADRVGRKPLILVAILAFTTASGLCALATSVPEMVAFRIVQGIAGALIIPISQATQLDINPPEMMAKAMVIFSMGTLLGPVFGPLVGGWLTENFNWRWVFLINLPFGLLSMAILARFLPNIDKIKRRFDLFGFALLALTLGSLQMMLDRGQQQDWFASWEICIEIGLVIGAGWMFVVHLLTARDPVIDPALFADRNFAATLLMSIVLSTVVIAGAALLPPMLQRLMGYTVLDSGLMSAPRGFGSMVAMVIVARTTRFDPRIMVLIGMVLAAASLWFMTAFNLEMDSRPVMIANFIQGFGTGLTWIPLTVLGFATISHRLRTSAAAIVALARSLGGSVGISIVTTVLARNIQTSHSDLAALITPQSMPPLDPSVIGMIGSGGDRVMAMLDAEINRQAAMVAYIDDFQMMMIATIVALPLILLLQKPANAEAPLVLE